MMKIASVAAFAALGACAAATDKNQISFEDFVKQHGRKYADQTEFELRRTIFEERRAAFLKHNAQGHSYTLAINHLADRSAAEIKQMKGFNKAAHFNMMAERVSSPKPGYAHTGPLAASLDWRTKGAVTPVKDQGGCGSCWAFGSAETLESHTFLHGASGQLPVLSPQQYVDCAPNPDHCGGTGGCQGSIPELAYKWSVDHGLAAESQYPYRGSDGQCKQTLPAAKVTGYVNVPSNNYTAVMEALQTGPLAITVDAGPWEFYDSGVFTGCPTDDIDLDHVVQLVGYGTEGAKDYWIVRNSWGKSFGEEGYVRIERHANSEFCGNDNKPADGTGCTGGPPTVKVCGSCGILYDAVYPTV